MDIAQPITGKLHKIYSTISNVRTMQDVIKNNTSAIRADKNESEEKLWLS
jgi:hypothetical protein